MDDNPESAGLSYYKLDMEKKLASVLRNIRCLPFGFDGRDIAEMKTTLVELGEKLQVDINSDTMMKRLNLREDGSGLYDIVITVVDSHPLL